METAAINKVEKSCRIKYGQAVYPINTMGLTKLWWKKVAISKTRDSKVKKVLLFARQDTECDVF
jgi:FlaA1/EpsC-like NDP-sugar epimerase